MAKKKKNKIPPYTQITMNWLRDDLGLTIDKVEHWTNGPAFRKGIFNRKRKDLFGVIDIIAVPSPSDVRLNKQICGVLPPTIIGVQSTSLAAVSQHIEKIEAEPRIVAWLAAGGGFWLVGWARVLIGNQVRWRPSVYVYSLKWQAGKPKLRHYSVNYFPRQELGRERE